MSYDPAASQFEVEIKRSRHHAQAAKTLIPEPGTPSYPTILAKAQVHATLSVAAAVRAVALNLEDPTCSAPTAPS